MTDQPSVGSDGVGGGASSDDHLPRKWGQFRLSYPVALESGERILSIGAGGGGYGPPIERDTWRVRRDVLEGWISRKHATDVYRVCIDAHGVVDEDATRLLRADAHQTRGQSRTPRG